MTTPPQAPTPEWLEDAWFECDACGDEHPFGVLEDTGDELLCPGCLDDPPAAGSCE